MGRLDVRVCSARNLPESLVGKPKTYCWVRVGPDEQSTHEQTSSNPVWDEVLKFSVPNAHECRLLLEIRSKSLVGSDAIIGRYDMRLDDLPMNRVVDHWYRLKDCDTNSEIRVRVIAKDFGISPPDDCLDASTTLNSTMAHSALNKMEEDSVVRPVILTDSTTLKGNSAAAAAGLHSSSSGQFAATVPAAAAAVKYQVYEEEPQKESAPVSMPSPAVNATAPSVQQQNPYPAPHQQVAGHPVPLHTAPQQQQPPLQQAYPPAPQQQPYPVQQQQPYPVQQQQPYPVPPAPQQPQPYAAPYAAPPQQQQMGPPPPSQVVGYPPPPSFPPQQPTQYYQPSYSSSGPSAYGGGAAYPPPQAQYPPPVQYGAPVGPGLPQYGGHYAMPGGGLSTAPPSHLGYSQSGSFYPGVPPPLAPPSFGYPPAGLGAASSGVYPPPPQPSYGYGGGDGSFPPPPM
jgi:hypothetical protein